MSFTLLNGNLTFADAPATLSLSAWLNNAWQPLPLTGTGNHFTAAAQGISAALLITPAHHDFHFKLSFTSASPTRLSLKLSLPHPDDKAPFHVIPGCIFGDNNLAKAEPGHYPNLTRAHAGNVSCSPYWEMRADRASHPVSILCTKDLILAVSIDPYSDGTPIGTPHGVLPSESFIRNGLFSQLPHDGLPTACGVTLGYANLPVTFLNKDQWEPSTSHTSATASAQGTLFFRPTSNGDRQPLHTIVQAVYNHHRQLSPDAITQDQGIASLVDAMLRVNWHDETGHNALGTFPGNCSPYHGGTLISEHFTNMRCNDPEKKVLTAWRMVPEVGWTGGGAIAYPLLIAGQKLHNKTAIDRAVYLLDWVASAFNPASGLLWDLCGKNQTSRVNGWWAGYLVKDVHSAYTLGNGLYYLLKSYRFAKNNLGRDHPAWLETALKALDTIVSLQMESGSFGFTYRTDRTEIVDTEGFAGAWFISGLALAYQLTGHEKYLDSAKRAIAFYDTFVQKLECWGTPLDTWKSPEQEGILGFIRGARLLHQLTRDEACLHMLDRAAKYEYLWRYGFKARPQAKPLAGSHFNSCGGSITSVSNPHVHPMGLNIASELAYLARHSGNAYHAHRHDDGNHFALNIISLYPGVSNYGIPGVLTERFCPSDGLIIETNPDGSPSSLWYSYNAWAATSAMEGLTETALNL
jgi:hypothetical protein